MIRPPQMNPLDAGGTRTGAVYRLMRNDIVVGRLAPSTKLLIDEMSGRYGVTSTPVREALNQLSTEGFVTRIEQRGFFVAEATKSELREITDTRCWIEAVALRESLAHRTAAWGEGLVLAGHRLFQTNRSKQPDVFEDNPEWEEAHKRFHMALIAACPSRWLLDFCSLMADHAVRYRYLSMSVVYPARNVSIEHKTLMEAAIDGPPEHAIDLLVQHYRQTADIILNSDIALPD